MKRGRPRIYATNAARQKAYRERINAKYAAWYAARLEEAGDG